MVRFGTSPSLPEFWRTYLEKDINLQFIRGNCVCNRQNIVHCIYMWRSPISTTVDQRTGIENTRNFFLKQKSHHRSAIRMGVVRQEVKRSAGSSGFCGRSSFFPHAANKMVCLAPADCSGVGAPPAAPFPWYAKRRYSTKMKYVPQYLLWTLVGLE